MLKGQTCIRIAGIKYPNDDGSDRESICRNCNEGEELVLKHTPVRQDKNAIKILRESGEQLGWIPREYTREIASNLDHGEKLEVVFKSLYRSINGPLSANIYVTKPGAGADNDVKNIPPLPPLRNFKSIEMKTCGVCGASVGDKVTKCPECHKSICVNCGNPLGAGVTKCPKCGEATKLGGIQALGFLLFFCGAFLIFIILLFLMC